MRKIIASLFVITSLLASATSFADPKVEFKTTMGNFVVELDSVKAPKTTANFLNYVNSGFYNGTIFHRVINGFMIQGGGFDGKMQQKASADEIKNEADNGLANDIYTIAMARTSAPHSASNQFFINVGNNDFLNYTISSMGNGFGGTGGVATGAAGRRTGFVGAIVYAAESCERRLVQQQHGVCATGPVTGRRAALA